MMTIRDLMVRAVDVPLRRQLGTSGGAIMSAPLLLLDLRTTDGVVGRAYVFCFDALGGRLLRKTLLAAAEVVADQPLDAAAIEALLDRRFRLVGARGLIGMALAGVDVAVWDALAQAAGQPLARYLGAEPVAVPAYNSNGLGIMGDRAVALDAEELVAEGFSTIKLRLGYDTIERDLNALRWVRNAVGTRSKCWSTTISCSQPTRRGFAARRSTTRAGLDRGADRPRRPRIVRRARRARPRRRSRSARTSWGRTRPSGARRRSLRPGDVRSAAHRRRERLAAGGADHRRGAGFRPRAISSPRSACICWPRRRRATGSKFVDWASPILVEPLVVRDGLAAPREVPGTGVAWDETAVARYLI